MKGYAIVCKNRLADLTHVLEDDGVEVFFFNEEEAECVAEEMRQTMGMNYYYWVVEREKA